MASALESKEIWGDEADKADELDDEIMKMSTDEIRQRARMIDNDIRIMKSEMQRIRHESESQREKIKENHEKIKLNKQLPYLVGNVVEVGRWWWVWRGGLLLTRHISVREPSSRGREVERSRSSRSTPLESSRADSSRADSSRTDSTRLDSNRLDPRRRMWRRPTSPVRPSSASASASSSSSSA